MTKFPFTQETNLVLSALKENGNVFIDDHDPKRGTRTAPHVVVVNVIREGQVRAQYVCPFYDHSYFSLNPFFLDKSGKPHLSTWAMGPTISPFRMLNTHNAKKLVEEWNHTSGENFLGIRYLLTLVE